MLHYGIGGVYPINNGDPQCEIHNDDDDDQEIIDSHIDQLPEGGE